MEGRAALWTFVGVFVMFKVATTIMIIAAAPEAASAIIGMFIAFHWPFMVAGLIFGIAPALFWWRLVRVRAKRAQLQAAEWRVDPPVIPTLPRM
jgi:hypothetical protein